MISNCIRYLKNNEIFLLNISILLFLGKGSLPFLKFPFIFLSCIISLYILIKYFTEVRIVLLRYIAASKIILILLAYYVVALIFSDRFYSIAFRDLLNTLVLLFYFFLLFFLVDENNVKNFIKLFFTSFLIFNIIAVVFFLNQIFNVFNSEASSYFLFQGIKKSEDFFSQIDNNFGILPVVIALIIIPFLDVKNDFVKICLSLIMVIFVYTIFLSFSRRALFVLIVVLGYFVYDYLKLTILDKQNKTRLRIRSFLIIFFLISFAVLTFFNMAGYSAKNQLLRVLGCKDLLDSKIKIANVILRYKKIIYKQANLNEVYESIWTPKFNPYDPESSWGTLKHKIVFPLSGKNFEIVPAGAKGYFLDKTCISSPEETYIDAPSLLINLKTLKGESYHASVFCYVSENFNGDLVRLTTATDCISRGIVKGDAMVFYDLDNKGTWRKLDINFTSEGGDVPVYITFQKRGVKDFRDLTGYVIFAYPYYEKKSEEVENIYYRTSQESVAKISESGMFPSLFVRQFKFRKDFIRNFHFSEGDTQQIFGSERFLRWKFAIKLYSGYGIKEKLFGNGFNFLADYGSNFMNDSSVEDWPHNPFLSILLYSGIFGCLLYCFFLYKVFYYYIKYIKTYPLLFIFFLITFFFSLFSSVSPFDPPVFGFFSILPFFIHSIHKGKITTKRDIS